MKETGCCDREQFSMKLKDLLRHLDGMFRVLTFPAYKVEFKEAKRKKA